MPWIRPEDWSRLAVVTLLAVILLAPSLFSRQVLLPLDLLTHYWPWAAGVDPTPVNNPMLSGQVEESLPYHAFLRRSVLTGDLPFWNPYSAFGTPLAGAPASGFFSPLRWLLFPLPTTLFFEFRALLALILAGAGIYLFCRRLELGPDASLAAAIAYELGGYTVYTLGHPSAENSAFFGWSFLFAETYLQEQRRTAALGLILTLVALYFSGQYQLALFQHLVLTVYVLVRKPSGWKAWTGLSLGALGMASIALVPFALHLFYEAGPSGGSGRQAVFLPFSTALHFLVPNYQSGEDSFFGSYEPSPGSFLFVGILPLLLALQGLRGNGRRPRWPLAAAALVALVLLWGIPPVRRLVSLAPLLQFANYLHMVQPFLAVSCVLAGFGLHDLIRGSHRSLGWLICLILAVNGLFWGVGFNTSASPEVLDRRPESLVRLLEAEHERVLVVGEAVLPPNTSTYYGIRDARGYQAIQPARYRKLMSEWLQNSQDAHFFVRPEDVDPSKLDLVGRLGCRLILSEAPLQAEGLETTVSGFPNIYTLADASRAEFASGIVPVEDSEEALQGILSSGMPPGSVFLEAPPGSPSFSSSGSVRWLRDEADRISLEVENESSAWLILRDSYHPNWRAYLDDEPIPIYRADYLFRAVHVPAGRHRVDYYYVPIWLGVGAIVSLVSLALVLLWLGWFSRQA